MVGICFPRNGICVKRSGINTAIEQMADDKIIFKPITITANTSGASGHPSATAQAGWADLLVDYIKTMNIA